MHLFGIGRVSPYLVVSFAGYKRGQEVNIQGKKILAQSKHRMILENQCFPNIEISTCDSCTIVR